jgi:hypothetical protein
MNKKLKKEKEHVDFWDRMEGNGVHITWTALKLKGSSACFPFPPTKIFKTNLKWIFLCVLNPEWSAFHRVKYWLLIQ